MSVPPVSVPIEIVVTGKIFPCPTGASLREVVDAIRDDSLLMGGHLERNGVAVIGGSITDEGIYRFVGGEVRSISKGTESRNITVQYRYKGCHEFRLVINSSENIRSKITSTIEGSIYSRPRDWAKFVVQAKDGKDLVGNGDTVKEGEVVIFYCLDEIVPVSSSKWTQQNLDQLKLKCVPVPIFEFFHNVFNLSVTKESISERSNSLRQQLELLDRNIIPYYGELKNADAIRHSREFPFTLLREIIVKKLFLTEKYYTHEAMVDSFVSTLLEQVGLNEGSLVVVPQLKLPLYFGESEEHTQDSIADFIILDVVSFYRMAIMEDKSVNMSRIDSFPQLVAEAISLHQNNIEKEEPPSKFQKVEGTKEVTPQADPVIAVRVNGTKFFFYAIIVSEEIERAMRTLSPAHSPTNCYQCGRTEGYDFWTKNDRDDIIFILDCFKTVISSCSSRSIRYNSK